MTNLKLFGLSLLCAMFGTLGYLYVERQVQVRKMPKLTRIAEQVYLTSQLTPEHLDSHRALRYLQIRKIVDLRPDGEAANQPSSQQMQEAASHNGMQFHYIPVPHESLPDECVDALREVLENGFGNTVLYCRTGRRAVRLFALAQASRPNGPNAAEIHRIVQNAGFEAADLRDAIVDRIAKRDVTSSVTK